jgi:hypothetical protein
MKEKLQEIYEGLKERLKSPFLLTFLIIWTIHNWEFVYGLVTFGSITPFQNRTAFLKAYLIVHSYYQLLWFPLAWTFASIGLYFIGSFLSEGINLTYNKWIRTWLYLLVDRNKLKTEDDYNELEERRKKLQELVFDLRRKEEDASLRLKNTEEILNKTIYDQREQIERYLHESADKEKLIMEGTSQLNSILKINKELEVKLQTVNSDLAHLQGAKSNLSNLRIWLESNYPDIIPKWEETRIERTLERLDSKFPITGEDIFPGKWELTYSRDGKPSRETVEVKDGNRYFANNIHAFDLTNVNVDSDSITLTKRIIKTGKEHSNETLKLIDTNTIYGSDSVGFALSYKKV